MDFSQVFRRRIATAFVVTFLVSVSASHNMVRALTGSTSSSGLVSIQSQISSGAAHTCAIGASNQVYCWGANYASQLGDGTTNSASTAIAISGWSGIAVAAGNDHTCVLGVNGSVTCAGYGTYGTLGDGTNNSSTTPVTAIASGATKIFAGTYHMCALLANGSAQCWGHNTWGQLGDGTWVHKNVPTNVVGVSGIQHLALGAVSTCALLSTGAVKCWGDNYYGQLGNGGAGAYSLTPVDVTGLSSGVVALTSGLYSTCAILSTGAVKCWGQNQYGELGNNSTLNSNVPVSVSGASTRFLSIAGLGYGYCGVDENYSVKCWGSNGFGDLGNGTTVDSAIPVSVTGLSGAVAVSHSNFGACVILSSGSAKCWGRNHTGQLGNNSQVDSYIPVTVIGFQTGVTATTTTTTTTSTTTTTVAPTTSTTISATPSQTVSSKSQQGTTAHDLPQAGTSIQDSVVTSILILLLGCVLLSQRRRTRL